jgi:hypothetical protein
MKWKKYSNFSRIGADRRHGEEKAACFPVKRRIRPFPLILPACLRLSIKSPRPLGENASKRSVYL